MPPMRQAPQPQSQSQRQPHKRNDVGLPAALSGALSLALRGVPEEQQNLIRAIVLEAIAHERGQAAAMHDELTKKLADAAVDSSQRAIKQDRAREERERESALERCNTEWKAKMEAALARQAEQNKRAMQYAVEQASRRAGREHAGEASRAAAEGALVERRPAVSGYRDAATAAAVEKALAENNKAWTHKLHRAEDEHRRELASQVAAGKEQAVQAALGLLRESKAESQRSTERVLQLARVEVQEQSRRAMCDAKAKAAEAHDAHLKRVTETITQDAARATQMAVRRAVQEAEAKTRQQCKREIEEASDLLRRENATLRVALMAAGLPLPHGVEMDAAPSGGVVGTAHADEAAARAASARVACAAVEGPDWD